MVRRHASKRIGDRFYDSVGALFEPLLSWLNTAPAPLAAILAGDYGVYAMLPFLLLYVPTVVVFTVLTEIYKSTGLIDRLSYAAPWLQPFGLGGRDLVRVVMGFGCNVPAVVATRSAQAAPDALVSLLSPLALLVPISFRQPLPFAAQACYGWVLFT